MSRAAFTLAVDVVAAVLLTALAATGTIIQFVLPPGTHRTAELWGLSRHDVGRVHAIVSAAFLATLAIHVALHWRWLVVCIWKRTPLPTLPQQNSTLASILVLALPIAALAALIVPATLGVRDLEVARHRPSGPRAPVASPTGLTLDPLDALAQAADDVLANRCARCHGAVDPDANFQADSTEALATPQSGRTWLAPGPGGELAAFQVLRATLPGEQARKHALSEPELRVLRGWAASVAEISPRRDAGADQ